MPNWPAGFPAPVEDQISEGAPRVDMASTPMDVGPKKRRRRSSAVRVPFALSFAPLTAAQVAQFRTFFGSDLGYGTLSFQMPHPFTDDVQAWRFEEDDAFEVQKIGEDAFELTTNLEMIG